MLCSSKKVAILACITLILLVPSAQAQYLEDVIYSTTTKAEILLLFSSGPPEYGTPVTYVTSGSTGSASLNSGFTITGSEISFTGMIDGYNVSVTASSNVIAATSPGTFSITNTFTTGSSSVTGDNFQVGGIAESFTTPLGTNLTWTNTITSSGLGSGPSANSASFFGYFDSDATGYKVPSATVDSNQSSTTTSQVVPANLDYALYIEGDFSANGHANTNASFTMTSLVASVPEPNGILIGLLGLPCMGAVVYFSRRCSSRMAAVGA